ncbi:NusB antitermination factor [Thermosyntropha lipolytica DSM 11003]|uniref:16S rRNA (cytosine(967)-C(5))-methyltransferase n=1 Tax=Thermosyntropha lipolytica DSM 11003 TaxID=1123382 RepID=A0A1M5RQZ5_9FIRM|nr:16S rRNA (cytosine(967)-C(5))-methyltransferase RsmB [Thermosyntropha lipolytica]SHH28646.1 NusB antitermination factor [Thermosyntropha lipolytica DSM 11003]
MDKYSTTAVSPTRNIAAQIIYEVTENGAYANLALAKFMGASRLSKEDKNLVTEMVNGTIRMLKHLDWVLNLFLQSRIERQNPWLRTVLRLSLYQLLFMDKIPAYAAVNEGVELVRKKANPALARVANGVLRSILRNRDKIKYPEDKVSYLAVYYSHPEWMVKWWLSQMPEAECIKMMNYNNKRPNLTLRTNVLKVSRDELWESLNKEGISCRKGSLTPWDIEVEDMKISLEDTESYNKGYFYIQNPASMLAAPILKPEPGEKVYDLCAGVGGKTTHLAEMMGNKGEIIAFDLYDHKIKLLKENCQRLGIDIVTGKAEDVLQIAESPEADKVLLDAPCSGLGVLNRRSDMRWKREKKDIAPLVDLQLKLLQKAGKMVKNGGFLLYSTCTINQEENEKVVEEFLHKNPHFEMVPFADRISFFSLDEKDLKAAAQGMLTIYSGKYNTDGMFYALMRRQDNY